MENQEVETQISELMARVGSTGIKVDETKLQSVSRELQSRLDILQREADTIATFPIKLSSRTQMAEYLFDVKHLPETPKRSVSQENLAHYSDPILLPFYEWSAVRRTLSLIEASRIFIVNGRLRTIWQTLNETSGRIYCSDFNVQQLPVPGRKALVADTGQVIMMLDYKQFELRTLAAFEKGEDLKHALNTGDPHRETAAIMLGVNPASITKEQREQGKVFNFGIVFGMEAAGLAQKLNCSRQEAQVKIDNFFRAFPSVKRYITRVILQAFEDKSVTNPLGHRRELPDWTDFDKTGRQAINTMIQGGAASLLKRGILRVSKLPQVTVLATVHDSIIVEFPTSEVETLAPQVAEAFAFQYEGVDFPVDFAIAASWGEAQEALK